MRVVGRMLVGLVLLGLIAWADPVELLFWHQEARPHRVERYEELCRRFSEEYPQYRINPVMQSWAQVTYLTPTATTVGRGPDFTLSNNALILALLPTGALQPVDDLVEELKMEYTFVPGALEPLSYGGHVYGVPVYRMTFMLHYRRDIFEQAGLDPDRPPETWSELLAACEALREAGVKYPIGVPGSLHLATDQVIWSLMVANGAQNVIDAERDPVVMFDTPETREAYEMYAKLFAYSPPGSETWKWDEPRTALFSGQVAIVLEKGHYIKGWVDFGAQPLDYLGSGFFPVPDDRKGEPVGAISGPNGFSLLTDDPEKVEGFYTFIRWLYKPSTMAWLLHMDPGFFLPITEDLLYSRTFWADEIIRQKVEAVMIQLKTLEHSYPLLVGDGKVHENLAAITGPNMLAQVAQRIVISGESVADAVAWGQRQMEEALKD